MAIQVPFPIPSTGFALNSKLRVNLDFIVGKFNEFNTGTATWDTVAVGAANNLTGTVTFYNSSNANYLTIQAGATGANTTYTLPTSLTSGYFLQTNGSGVLSWAQAVNDGLGGYLAMYDAATGATSNNLQAYKMYNSNFFRIAIADQGSLSSTRTYTIPNTGVNTASFLMSEGSGSINGNLTILAPGYLSTSILRFVNSVTCEISMASGGVGHSLTWPSTQGGSNTVLSNNGSGTLSWATIGSLGGVATTALSNLASVAINTSLVSDTDNTDNLGSSSVLWANIYGKAFQAGRSGSAGTIQIFPTTASKGWLWINATANSGDTEVAITNAAMSGTRAITIPDPGTLSSNFVLSEGTATINGAKTLTDLRGTLGANLAAATFKLTGLGAGTTAGDSVRYEQLKVLQVVTATSTTAFTTTSSTFQASNLSASITPSSTSSKIMIIATGAGRNNAIQTDAAYFTIARGGTNLLATLGVDGIDFGSATGVCVAPITITYLDSPASTSSLTYDVRVRNSANAITVGFGVSNTTQSIILIEVAG